jgi:hypothetical protein
MSDERRRVQADLNAEAERVMSESRPTPTQEEADKLKTGEMKPTDIEHVDQPTMPPLHEQQAKVAEADAKDAETLRAQREQEAADRAAARAGTAPTTTTTTQTTPPPTPTPAPAAPRPSSGTAAGSGTVSNTGTVSAETPKP